MPSLEQYEAYHANITDGQVSRKIEGTYNRARDQFFKETGHGALSFLTSGFGKGALLTAGLIVGVSALVVGALASVGNVHAITEYFPMLAKGAPLTLEEGLLKGAGMGLRALVTPLGVGAVAGVGLVSGLQHAAQQKNEVAMAMQQAEMRQAMQSLAQEQGKEPPSQAQHAPMPKGSKHPPQPHMETAPMPREAQPKMHGSDDPVDISELSESAQKWLAAENERKAWRERGQDSREI